MDPDLPEPPPATLPQKKKSDARPFIAIAFFLVLAAIGWFIVDSISQNDKFQDCTMSGRRNCAPIDTSTLK